MAVLPPCKGSMLFINLSWVSTRCLRAPRRSVTHNSTAYTASRWAFYGLRGEWEVENHGIAPDVEVDLDPKLVREGHDPQLERAVAVAMDLLKKNPPVTYEKPRYPNYHQHFEEPTPEQ